MEQIRPKQSLLEHLADQLIKEAGLPIPIREYRLCDDRRWRGDYVWVVPEQLDDFGRTIQPGKLVLLEIEGGLYLRNGKGGRHNTPDGMMKDMEKYNYASIAGYTVIRCAKKHLLNGQAIEWVKEALGFREKNDQ
jgi:hypothetical protein